MPDSPRPSDFSEGPESEVQGHPGSAGTCLPACAHIRVELLGSLSSVVSLTTLYNRHGRAIGRSTADCHSERSYIQAGAFCRDCEESAFFRSDQQIPRLRSAGASLRSG